MDDNEHSFAKFVKLLIVSIYHNRENMIHESVGSVVRQLDDDMHLLLVDDGSTDKTYEELMKWRGPKVSAVTQRNSGFVHALAKAIPSIDSKYIAIHGSGDISLPNRFLEQMRVLDADPSVGVVGCRTLQRSSDLKYAGKVFGFHFKGDARHIIGRQNLFTHGEVMMRRDIYQQAGGYRTYFKFAQDRDLWCRMSVLTHFHVLDEVLYQRMAATEGSVGGTPEKLLIQRYLSHLAVYCHEERLAGRPDPLEQFGPCCAFLRDKSSVLRREFRELAFRAVASRNESAAAMFTDAYLREGGSCLLARALLAIVRGEATTSIAAWSLRMVVCFNRWARQRIRKKPREKAMSSLRKPDGFTTEM